MLRRILPALRSRLQRPGRALAVHTSASAGSLGDQAMLEALRQGWRSRDDAPFLVVERRYWESIPLQGEALRRKAPGVDDPDHARWLSGMTGASRAGAVIGADVMDGRYGVEEVRSMVGLLRGMAAAGRPAAVIGFSFSREPHPEAIELWRGLDGVRFHARDRISAERFEAATGRAAIDVADVAFLLEPKLDSAEAKSLAEWSRGRRAGGRRVIGVCFGLHSLEAAGADAQSGIGASFAGWLDDHPQDDLLLLPHDTRPEIGDVEALGGLRAFLADKGLGERVKMPRAVLGEWSAWNVKALTAETDAIVTGRMHLAIGAFGMARPPASITYAGKFEGLYRRFGLDGLMMTPQEAMHPEAFGTVLQRLLDGRDAMRARAADALPGVQALSRRNFDWLDGR